MTDNLDPTACFSILAATDILSQERLVRHQELRGAASWFAPGRPPLCVLFISHRWETPEHPDPKGRQLRALQKLIRLIVRWVGAAFLEKPERDPFMPDLSLEGSVQALAIAMRILDLEQMPGAPMPGEQRRAEVSGMARELGPQSDAFAAWLTTRIGIWIDYCSVPQAPWSDAELQQLRASLRRLDGLIDSATLVALRFADDRYAHSGWCVAESLVSAKDASGRGFARNVFVDLEALNADRPLYMPERAAPPLVPDAEAAQVMQETYEQAARGFAQDRARLQEEQYSYVQVRPANLWSSYQDVMSGSFHARDIDPNPLRRALEFILGFEEALVRRWLFSPTPVELDLVELVEEHMTGVGLRCTAPADLAYLGLLLARRGRVGEIRPLLEACFARYVDHILDAAARQLHVRLHPTSQAARDVLSRAKPASAGVWRARLVATTNVAERELVARLRAELASAPPRFELVER